MTVLLGRLSRLFTCFVMLMVCPDLSGPDKIGDHNSLPKNPMPRWKGLVSPLTLFTGTVEEEGEYNPDAVDPLLSQIGKEQMANLAKQFRTELPSSTGEGMILPTKVFTSILRRTCQCSIDVWAPICEAPIIALQVSPLANELMSRI
jgi:hypothetical protein